MSSPSVALFLPSLEGGGAERVFVQLANQFATFGCRVDLVLAAARGPYLDEVSRNVRVLDLQASGVLRALPGLVRYLRTTRPEAMLSGLEHANVIAILARYLSGNKVHGVVSVRSIPTMMYELERSPRAWITLKLAKVGYHFADAIVANSRFAARDLAASFGISEKNVQVIYNPLDSKNIEESSFIMTNHPWLESGAPPLVLGVGSLLAVKDFPTLIRAFDIVRSGRECRLVILGEGRERQALESLIENLGLQGMVQLPGFVNNPFVWMRHAKVVVSSSLTEGCPNVLMQALACGASVVSTDCPGGSAEVLEDGKWGRLVPVGDAVAMAKAIASALDQTVKSNTQVRANDFAIDGIARQYLRILLPDYTPAARR